jgi:DNA processing protein
MHKINSFRTDQMSYTQIISSIANIPKRLWLYGNLPDSRIPTAAIVGTRKPTPYGRDVTYRLSYELASRGIVVLSGLALGVDGIAHQAALDAGGITIAVLPTPLETISPRSHRDLAEKIVARGGALVSEYSITDPVYKVNFLARNRIVAGLADGVLITEAAARSGTLSTANAALQQGKPVMAVPGNITSAMSVACNNLIKTGATPVTEVGDILHELGLRDRGEQTELPLASTAEEAALLKLLMAGVKEGELLHQQSGLPAAEYSQTMTMLEIEGKIRSLGANQWTIRR